MVAERTRILVIAGPTASGKSALAVNLAEKLGGEIISCDSMQIYRGMDIGSAKPTKEEQARVPHHMIDVADPKEAFSAAKYARMARKAIREIAGRGKLPVVCGGTGLYLNGILYEMDFGDGPEDPDLRRRLECRAEEEGGEALHRELAALDPAAAARIHPNNVKKIIRALERLQLGEERVQEFQDIRRENPEIDPVLIGLTMDRKKLYGRIERRVEDMMARGLMEEVRRLAAQGLTAEDISMQGIGYKELIAFLSGENTLEEAVAQIKKNTRHYAKRQLTWFRRYRGMVWFDLTDDDAEQTITGDVLQWLKKRK
ncbi:MAG: tRNA (adenosine(37)-N6)-dimethylallyltransferase MiaA [Bacillota bacterium]|nr:tRNA (adenosine(37)-N6)-dimethylallyltransferase MiaA [Bacillota bacterium]